MRIARDSAGSSVQRSMKSAVFRPSHQAWRRSTREVLRGWFRCWSSRRLPSPRVWQVKPHCGIERRHGLKHHTRYTILPKCLRVQSIHKILCSLQSSAMLRKRWLYSLQQNGCLLRTDKSTSLVSYPTPYYRTGWLRTRRRHLHARLHY